MTILKIANCRSLFAVAVCTLLLAYMATGAFAEVYRWTDANGKVHYSDKKPVNRDTKAVEIKVSTIRGVSYGKSNINSRSRADSAGASSGADSQRNKSVVMYSAAWCGMCTVARNYFKKNRVRFTEYDVEKTRIGKRDYKKLKGRGVPIILVGKLRMNGFSAGGFQRLYAMREMRPSQMLPARSTSKVSIRRR